MRKTDKNTNNSITRMPTEITPPYICVSGQFFGMPPEIDVLRKMNLSSEEYTRSWDEIIDKAMGDAEKQRGGFALYYIEGGKDLAFADFRGRVVKIEKDRGMLFDKVWYHYILPDYEAAEREGSEDHVWIRKPEVFLAADIQPGDCVKFKALSYAYKRSDGSVDFGLKCPEDIEKIADYELPDQDMLDLKSSLEMVEQSVCETCTFAGQCYKTVCLLGDNEREDRCHIVFSSNPLMLEDLKNLVMRTAPGLDEDAAFKKIEESSMFDLECMADKAAHGSAF